MVRISSTVPQHGTTREYITADGRDLSKEEWRRIPGFPSYQITRDGDVRNINTGKLLTELENKVTGAYFYSVWDRNGKARNRNYASLVALAYEQGIPESEWKAIPSHPSYQVTRDGTVRNTRTKKLIKVHEIDKYKERTIRLRRDGIHCRVQIRKLVEETWPMWSEEEEAA